MAKRDGAGGGDGRDIPWGAEPVVSALDRRLGRRSLSACLEDGRLLAELRRHFDEAKAFEVFVDGRWGVSRSWAY